MLSLSRLIAALAYAGAAFLFGVGMGERGELGFVQHVFAAVIPIATIVLTWLSRGARFDVILTGAAMLAGLFLGQRSFRIAYDECLREGPRVRAAIVAFRAEHDNYPARLEDLDVDVPCECILRDTILHYLSNDRAFRLWISNERDVVNFTASGRSSDRSSPTTVPRR
jgi:hypothetical protein